MTKKNKMQKENLNLYIIQTFLRWLKDNNHYYRYKLNIRYDNIINTLLIDLRNGYRADYLIESSFDWDESYEGWDFWSDVDDMWTDYCNAHNL